MKIQPCLEELRSVLTGALERFNKSIDRETLLLSSDPALEKPVAKFRVAHEQAITHRLAFYLECSLRTKGIISDAGPLVLDCEYNQHLFDRKKLRVLLKDADRFIKAGRAAIEVEGREDVLDFEVRPDILVHRRGFDAPTNLMLLEVKRYTNPERQHDELKLRLFTEVGENSFGYVLGAAVYARNDRNRDERQLVLGPGYQDGARIF